MSFLNDVGIVCSLGHDKDSVFDSLINKADEEYLKPWSKALDSDKVFWCGQVAETSNMQSLLDGYEPAMQTRNNQLAMLAYQQIKPAIDMLTQDMPATRIAVVVGTSTSGIKEGEVARQVFCDHQQWPSDFDYALQEMVSPADFIATVSGAKGPVYSISTACSSSAKALASARALLQSDLADLVICGGVDTLSHLPNNGFNALESIAATLCNPLSAERDGINIGEGAALFVMSRQTSPIMLRGVGETSDAHHISAPHPEGIGAQSAMQQALNDAGLSGQDIDYINLHGTATPKNDAMETLAVSQVFGEQVPCSSTKRFTGHTLGAAGAIEAALLWLLLSPRNTHGALPKNKSDFGIAPDLARIAVSQGHSVQRLDNALSNSFAFGGNNISVILGKTA
ncbi:beta-ketoacyl-ACP synthase [Thalassotalea marina]|uniref:Beta-ketoacyl-[acyl-carrier-protein] synthase II n=1 Tax=Thalassotalea marina TaxID=1673741 RepID=A0A919BKW2_9GAMM|nr:beta-ketoacyl-ACP synthase [Thalassotalea marina]GHF97100.1 beta-ketoacyl-[acyl-carrier-protein] synthase II [Thalassotalea marina]